MYDKELENLLNHSNQRLEQMLIAIQDELKRREKVEHGERPPKFRLLSLDPLVVMKE